MGSCRPPAERALTESARAAAASSSSNALAGLPAAGGGVVVAGGVVSKRQHAHGVVVAARGVVPLKISIESDLMVGPKHAHGHLFFGCRWGLRSTRCSRGLGCCGRSRIRIPGVAEVKPLSILLARDREKLARLDDGALHRCGIGTRLPAYVARDADLGFGIHDKNHPGRLRLGDVLDEEGKDRRPAPRARRARWKEQRVLGIQ